MQSHVHDERSNTLQLYWKKGVDVIRYLAENKGDPHLQRIKQTAEKHAQLMEASSQSVQAESALFEDDDEEDEAEEGQIVEVQGGAGTAKGRGASVQRQKSANAKKEELKFEGYEETSAGHCIQTVKELQTSACSTIGLFATMADLESSRPFRSARHCQRRPYRVPAGHHRLCRQPELLLDWRGALTLPRLCQERRTNSTY
jgi:hypothetical protein